MLKKILIGVAFIVVGFLGLVAIQPSDYRITRSATIAAPPETVFAHVNELRQWDAWSPWAKLDPNVKNTFQGPASGKGAIFMWSGNDDVGEGRMTILESRPGELVRMQLDFLKPMEDTCTTEFNFQPQGEQTVVTWSMFGKNSFVGKAFCLFMSMD